MPRDTVVALEAIAAMLETPNEFDSNGEPANVVDALFAIARGLESVAKAIHKLGVADACTPMGAIESHSIVVKEAAERIADAIACVQMPLRLHKTRVE